MQQLQTQLSAQSELASWLAKEDAPQPPTSSRRFMGTTPRTPQKRSMFSKRSVDTGTAFSGLQTETGSKDLMAWFCRNRTDEEGGLDELHFVKVVRNMTNLADFVLCDFFDLFDVSGAGVVRYPEFHLCISLLCALESREMTHFMYLHGKRLFLLLHPTEEGFVHIEGLKMVMQFLLLQESEIQDFCKLFVRSSCHRVDLPTFLLIMSCVADDWDSQATGRKKLYKPKPEKRKTSKSTKNKTASNLDPFDNLDDDPESSSQSRHSSSSDEEHASHSATVERQPPSGNPWDTLGPFRHQAEGCRIS